MSRDPGCGKGGAAAVAKSRSTPVLPSRGIRKLAATGVVALLAVSLACPASAAEFAGLAHVIDGDTLTVAGLTVRLEAIDAPETDQVCLDATARRWTCGLAARAALARLVEGRPVTCRGTSQDRYGRTLAHCSFGAQDLQGWMVRSGHAVSFKRYAHDYDADEDAARLARAGLWAGAFVAPWDWRARNSHTVVLGAQSVPLTSRPELLGAASAAAPPDPACVIKGNVSASGERIYHLPGQHFYAKVDMGKGHGERWFCSEREAQAAGWRKALH